MSSGTLPSFPFQGVACKVVYIEYCNIFLLIEIMMNGGETHSLVQTLAIFKKVTCSPFPVSVAVTSSRLVLQPRTAFVFQ